MLLRLKLPIWFNPVRRKGIVHVYQESTSHTDKSKIPTSIGELTPYTPGNYPKPPPLEEFYKAPRYVRLFKKKPTITILDCGPHAKLPDAYRKFYIEWKLTYPKSVHIDERPGKYNKEEETGRVLQVQNVPLPLLECPQEEKGLWGGEVVLYGYYHVFTGAGKFGGPGKVHDKAIMPKFWFPRFRQHVIYSEILNIHMVTVVTRRTILLINQHFGLDHYILANRACDLRNTLAVKLKRKLLQTLLDKSMYPEDEKKRDEIYTTYGHYLNNYTPEEIDWYGLTLTEACKKLKWANEKMEADNPPVPLKHKLRQEYVNYLRTEKPEIARLEPWYKRKLISFK